jgi:hypothetical protein
MKSSAGQPGRRKHRTFPATVYTKRFKKNQTLTTTLNYWSNDTGDKRFSLVLVLVLGQLSDKNPLVALRRGFGTISTFCVCCVKNQKRSHCSERINFIGHSNIAQPSKFDKCIRASFEPCTAPQVFGESTGAGKGTLGVYGGGRWLDT